MYTGSPSLIASFGHSGMHAPQEIQLSSIFKDITKILLDSMNYVQVTHHAIANFYCHLRGSPACTASCILASASVPMLFRKLALVYF